MVSYRCPSEDEDGDRGPKNILMACDFFHPNVGGVEQHIYQLSQCLIATGHHVVVLTHSYGGRSGVRWLTNGLKVYHIPKIEVRERATFPSLFSLARLIRCVILREEIDVVHAHTTFSSIAFESVLHGRTMGLPVVFTDHSLFGFANITAIMSNKLLSYAMHDVHRAICVSHTAKENTVLRSGANPGRVSVVPNAVDSARFFPKPSLRPNDRIRIVVMCRLAYRKGVDLLLRVVPMLCALHGDVEVCIGGTGPRERVLRQAWVTNKLSHRVKMLGHVDKPEEVLNSGHIFLNLSLTESFCMAALEAASCGLLVVSTCVGKAVNGFGCSDCGRQILPEDMMHLAEPNEKELVGALEAAISRVRGGHVAATDFHRRLSDLYSWWSVAKRVEAIYGEAKVQCQEERAHDRLRRLNRSGRWFGKMLCLIVAWDVLLHKYFDLVTPAHLIDRAPSPRPLQTFDSGKAMECQSAALDAHARRLMAERPLHGRPSEG